MKEYKFDLARDSLRFLIKQFKIKELYLPYYLCDVIRHAVMAENCNPVFYHVDDNFYPVQEFPKESYILYPNYFGICDENVNNLEKVYSKLIVDNAHAYYAPPQGFACFNSERKFLPVEKGSSLWVKVGENEFLKMKKEGRSDIQYPICPSTRIERFKRMHRKFYDMNQLKFDIDSIRSPFCYPYLAPTNENADEIAKKHTDEGLSIYRYWNNMPKSYNEYKFYRRLVPIPI